MKTLMKTHLTCCPARISLEETCPNPKDFTDQSTIRSGVTYGEAAGQFHVYVTCHEYVYSQEHFAVSGSLLLCDLLRTGTTAPPPRVASAIANDSAPSMG